jgi:hypothetical protein
MSSKLNHLQMMEIQLFIAKLKQAGVNVNENFENAVVSFVSAGGKLDRSLHGTMISLDKAGVDLTGYLQGQAARLQKLPPTDVKLVKDVTSGTRRISKLFTEIAEREDLHQYLGVPALKDVAEKASALAAAISAKKD